MKKLLVISALLNAALLAGLTWREMLAHAQVDPIDECILLNGDVNGDQTLNRDDAVYILKFLYAGGEEPAPRYVADVGCLTQAREELAACRATLAEMEAALATCQGELATCTTDLGGCQGTLSEREAELTACKTELEKCKKVSRPPATGQTKCYDAAGAEIDCASADFPGQDGFYQTGCPTEGRFVDNQDGTVTDTCTGLMWQKDTADVDGNGSFGPGDGVNWQVALQYCENLNFAGHTDWRLPNIRELQNLANYCCYGPAIDPVFTAQWGTFYWSSTSVAYYPNHVWGVHFIDGTLAGGFPWGIDVLHKTHTPYVRAVRGGL